MKLIHSAVISVFCKELENLQEITRALRSLAPIPDQIQIESHAASGFNEKKIIILELRLEKEKHTNAFLRYLAGRLGREQLGLVLNQKHSRLDDEFCFFLRLDKPALLKGEYKLIDQGNCFHIKLSIAAFPKTRQAALEVVSKIFSTAA